MDKFKDKIADNIFLEAEVISRKKSNAVNKFLNLYFKYIAVFIVFVFLWGATRFFIKPKFDQALFLSNNTLTQKRTQFVNEYNKMENNRKVIAEYEEIDPEIIDKISKMIPVEYSRDDLFTEITYFLIKNEYKINNISVVNPLATTDDSVSGEGSVSGRRGGSDDSQSDSLPHINYVKTLPPEIGSWFITVSLLDVDYYSLKRLITLLEDNLKIMDIFSIDFQPSSNIVNISILTYYHKN
jgi:hypothetical protein